MRGTWRAKCTIVRRCRRLRISWRTSRLEQGFAQERSRPRQVAAALPPPPSPDDVARVRGIVKGISDRLTRVVRRNTEEELQAKAEEFLRQQLCEANASFSTPASAVAATEPGIAAKGEAKASARPAAAPSVFELDPADWNA